METMLLSNAAAFFAAVRVDLFGGAIEQTQVDGINSILRAWPEGTDPRFVDYGLATAYHETARTIEAIAEWSRGQGKAKAYGTLAVLTGSAITAGLIQLTWLPNDERAEEAISGSDLAPTPDNALLPAIAAEVIVRGMSEGWFTGKRLADFFPPGAPERHDWVGARALVNGRDRAVQIAAAYTVHFNAALAEAPPSLPRVRSGPGPSGRAPGVYSINFSRYIADIAVKSSNWPPRKKQIS